MTAWIFTAGGIHPDNIPARPEAGDLLIAADAGLKNAQALGVRVSVVVGDFDSLGTRPKLDPDVEIISVPAEKDETDTAIAVTLALERGADLIHIIGGLDGRLDHTLANLSLLERLESNGIHATIENGQNRVRYLRASSTLLARTKYRYISLIPIDPLLKGVEIEGCKYPLKNAKLTRTSTGLSVSNEIVGNCCLISVRKGAMYIVEAMDR
ncbi:MAG: thiamine diphosphokinase [Clostridia bacterium]|nr:thiamine diphosphokinase [Clostridia bacterium]